MVSGNLLLSLGLGMDSLRHYWSNRPDLFLENLPPFRILDVT